MSIADGCEHAMVVVAEGGACVCVACRTRCPGRFRGCDAVTATPGALPTFAPDWARTAPPPADAPPAAVAPVAPIEPDAADTPPAPDAPHTPDAADTPHTPDAADRPPAPNGSVEDDVAALRALVERRLASFAETLQRLEGQRPPGT